ncbi:MAG: hypothetical protein ABGW77_02425 [Campylobacterales bacterium]
MEIGCRKLCSLDIGQFGEKGKERGEWNPIGGEGEFLGEEVQ